MSTDLSDWLEIGLEILEEEIAKELILRITFRNVSKKNEELWFSNARRGAEKMGLKITSVSDDRRIGPEDLVYVSPLPYGKAHRRLAPRDEWAYDLVAQVDGPYLRFPGASYRLVLDCGFVFQFGYRGAISQKVEWTMSRPHRPGP